ncbi:efflux transporter outer membrane subunit [Pedosphaera parvula]|uniref:RND efflux system, outer membrane lipoprotein, NodT family n=1 Tax=Pedosphaera parvula (strain Ellin514) TaxID=320771 RepID=B9XBA8_PEDPL|nr:efflux transporter outer membrane subunit [Pedosphaera parvula]EEF62793.1 RND efflux system, outer membrane lipoprotein, NodT family [Pedosphaera parvula Ellin514]
MKPALLSKLFPVACVWSSGLVTLFVAGCAVGPDYKRPEATVIPPAYKEGTNGWKLAEPQAHIPRGAWWEIFQDSSLNALETEAAKANQELQVALESFEQARALLSVARSGYYPHIEAIPSVTRERDSANRPINGVSIGRADTFNTFSFPLDLSYELDVWGRVRRSVESAKATMQASADDLATVKLSIQAEVANDYFNLRALDSEISLLRSNVVVFGKSLELTRNRRAGGVASDLDVSQAETILKTTEAQLPAIALQRAKAEHALAVLTGKPASSFSVPEMPFLAQPPNVPSGLPSDLLERRPDIATAERLMAAANAGIGVAKAAFYPTIKINGLAGFESVSAGTLFDWPSRFWAVGPSIKLPIFEGGENRANLTHAQAAYRENVARYRQSVLVAFSEVEDNLAAQHLLWSQQEAENAALKAAEKTLEIANNRYRAGLVTYLEVATAQNAALDRERENVRLRGERLLSTVSLIKSLGGGWEAPKQLSSSH